MTDLQVRRDGGESAPLRTPLELSEHLHAAASSVVVERDTGERVQATLTAGRRWVVEVVDDPHGPGVRAGVPNTDAAYDALRSWCNGDGWWAEAFGWQPAD